MVPDAGVSASDQIAQGERVEEGSSLRVLQLGPQLHCDGGQHSRIYIWDRCRPASLQLCKGPSWHSKELSQMSATAFVGHGTVQEALLLESYGAAGASGGDPVADLERHAASACDNTCPLSQVFLN